MAASLRPEIQTGGGVVGLGAKVTLAGATGSLYANLSDPVWFHLPSDYPLGALFFELVQWLLMGLTLALFLGRPAEAA